LDRSRPVLQGAPRHHRVAGRLARSARQKSRDGLTGGSGLGSAVLGSRDLVRIVARSRETGTLGLRLKMESRILLATVTWAKPRMRRHRKAWGANPRYPSPE